MIETRTAEQTIGVTLLALLLAGLIWLAVTLEHPVETTLRVAVLAEGVPAGLELASSPGEAQVTLAGPRILLFLPWLHGVACRVDLSGAAPGVAEYRTQQGNFGLDPELKVVRVQPATVRLELKAGAANKLSR